MEECVREWIEEQKRRGTKCMEVKKIGNNYYVYRSTTYWDKKEKKRKKRSEYVGKTHTRRTGGEEREESNGKAVRKCFTSPSCYERANPFAQGI